jgi:hypothetical protein
LCGLGVFRTFPIVDAEKFALKKKKKQKEGKCSLCADSDLTQFTN